MRTVLVAPIGDHPVVITAAVDKLGELGVNITDVDLIYTAHPLVRQGAEWVELFLEGCDVHMHPLTTTDINSQDSAEEYLQALAAILLSHEQMGDAVHLLLSGGRKNMSALTAVVAGLFFCIKGLCHILDKYEHDSRRHNFFTIEELSSYPDDIKQTKMHPPLETVNLFRVSFPHYDKAGAEKIRDYLLDPSSGIPDVLLSASSEALSFYRGVFRPQKADRLEVWLTEQAFQQFTGLWQDNRALAEEFRSWFKLMSDPEHLKAGYKGTFGQSGATLHFFKRRRTAERPFFFTRPNPIHLYPQQEVSSVVLHGFSKEQKNGAYAPTAEQLLADADLEPRYRSSDLPRAERAPAILLIPLGDTPMVASQAYVLLSRQNINITHVVLLYPSMNAKIRNAAEDLANDFKNERLGCNCVLEPIENLDDVDSFDACNIYLEALAETIQRLQQDFSGHEIHLLLSGGRKSMAALNFFAAQYTHLSWIWHTLVKDSKLEEQIQRNLDQSRANPRARRDILFLRTYSPEDFDIFEVPVIPLNIQERQAKA